MKKIIILIPLVFCIFFSGCVNVSNDDTAQEDYKVVYNDEIYSAYDNYYKEYRYFWFPLAKETSVVSGYSGIDYEDVKLYKFKDKSLNMFLIKKNFIFENDLFLKTSYNLPNVLNDEIEYIIIVPDNDTVFLSKKALKISNKSDIEQLKIDFINAYNNIRKDENNNINYNFENSVMKKSNENEKPVFVKYKSINALHLFGYLQNFDGKFALFFYQSLSAYEDNFLNWILSEKSNSVLFKQGL